MKIIGHRGARGLAPENTMAAFGKAREYGADEIEFDVRVTKDGIPILAHDAVLHDAAGSALSISASTYAALCLHRPDVLKLSEALQYLTAVKATIQVELKPNEPVEPVIAILEHYHTTAFASSIWLASRDQKSLLALHRALPDFGTIVIEWWSGIRATRHARQLGTKRISMLEVWLWPGFIRAMSRNGYQIFTFPFENPAKEQRYAKFGLGGVSNSPQKARRWSTYGLTGVITDFPDRFADKRTQL